MSLTIILTILLIHWIADFVLQTHWQATNKSTNNSALLQHVLYYSLTWLIIGVGLVTFNLLDATPVQLLKFTIITFICHFITDYITSRLNSHLYAKGDIHNFFVSIGFDQWIHYVQLFITFYLIFK